jgi:ribosomal protein L29
MFSPQQRQSLITELDRLLAQSRLKSRLGGHREQRHMLQRLRDLLAQPDGTKVLNAEIAALTAQRDALRAEIVALNAQKATQQTDNPETHRAIENLSTLTHHRLRELDSSVELVFRTLQQHLQTYAVDLEQGLDRMHLLSGQSEILVSSLVSRLLQQASPDPQPKISPQPPAAVNPDDRIGTLGELLSQLTQSSQPQSSQPQSSETQSSETPATAGNPKGSQDFTLRGMGDISPPAPEPNDMNAITLADIETLFALPDKE